MKKIRLLDARRRGARARPRARRWPTSRSASACRSPARPPASASRCKNGIELWPKDDRRREAQRDHARRRDRPDATGVKNARRFVTEDKVDMIIGSVADAGRRGDGRRRRRRQDRAARCSRRWTCRRARTPGRSACRSRNAVMAHAMVEHMKKQGVKTVGFLGYTDAYGEAWLKDFTPVAEKAGIKLVAVERFARTDTSVTGAGAEAGVGQPRRDPDRRLGQRRGDAAQGRWSSAATRARSTRRTRAATTRPDAHRRQGRRGRVRRRPARRWSPSSCPTAIRRKKARACEFVTEYEKALRRGLAQPVRRPRVRRRRSCCEKAVPIALKKAKPGTPGVPRRAEGRDRDDGPHACLARRAQLDHGRPLGLHATRPA